MPFSKHLLLALHHRHGSNFILTPVCVRACVRACVCVYVCVRVCVYVCVRSTRSLFSLSYRRLTSLTKIKCVICIPAGLMKTITTQIHR